jgi:sugar phosphate isomerase/epimerase
VSRVTVPAADVSPAVSDFTFSFNCIGEVPLAERFAAARAAGFTDVGISLRWTKAWLAEGHTLDELDSLIADAGVRVTELEAIRVMREEPDPLEDLAAVLAERLRPARLQAIGPYDGTLDDAAQRAGRVADRFAPWGVDVVLEPLPFTNMQTPADAAAIILRADRPNLSMCMDVWHLYRMGLPLSHLDGLWPSISTVQFNDGTVDCEHPEDLREDCLLNRRVPGEGEFDLVGLIRARNAHRPDSTFSIEVINTTLRQQDAALSAQQIAAGLDAVLAASRVA